MGIWLHKSGVQRHKSEVVRIYIVFIAMRPDDIAKGMSIDRAKRCGTVPLLNQCRQNQGKTKLWRFDPMNKQRKLRIVNA